MKKHLYILLFFIANISHAQITLEHTYPDFYVTRGLLNKAGEKYYYSDIANKQVKFFNADHSLWKTISLTIPAGAELMAVTHVSENKINPDALIEIAYYYSIRTGSTSRYEARLINENGSVLMTFPDVVSVFLSELDGYQTKLTTTYYSDDEWVSSVYSLPDLIQEHTYTYSGDWSRINLENSGEKYYIYNRESNQMRFYNADHSFWKSINLPMPADAELNFVSLVSETALRTDNLIEVGYSYYYHDGTYEGRIINERGNILLTTEDVIGFEILETSSNNNKLIVSSYDGESDFTKIYSIPNLTLEHTYEEGLLSLETFKIGGKKYCLLDSKNNEVNIYNIDHTLWKTIELPTSNNSEIHDFFWDVSDNKINSDDKIEVLYTYVTFTGGSPSHLYEGRIVNEDGDILLTVPDASNIHLDELEGLPNKLLVYTSELTTHVYSLPTIGTGLLDFTNDLIPVTIYPNPASDFLSLSIEKGAKPDKISIYNLEGRAVIELNYFDNQPIKTSDLNKGMYIITGTQNGTLLFKDKFIVH